MPHPKRSIPYNDIAKMKDDWRQTNATAGDQPWFCWFNQTLLEFYLYTLQDLNTTSSTTTAATPTSTSMYASQGLFDSSTTYNPSVVPSILRSSWPTQAVKFKRDDDNDEYDATYPLQIKMTMKRVPHPNSVRAYCQQMRILNTGEMVPQEGVDIVPVDETWTMSSSSKKRDVGMFHHNSKRYQVGCCCEITSDGSSGP